MAEQIREILVQEQDHRIDLATALGEEVPDVSAGPQATYFAQASLTLLARVGTVVAKIVPLRISIKKFCSLLLLPHSPNLAGLDVESLCLWPRL
jgi:hypothetical protein